MQLKNNPNNFQVKKAFIGIKYTIAKNNILICQNASYHNAFQQALRVVLNPRSGLLNIPFVIKFPFGWFPTPHHAHDGSHQSLLFWFFLIKVITRILFLPDFLTVIHSRTTLFKKHSLDIRFIFLEMDRIGDRK